MRRATVQLLLVTVLSLVLNGCRPSLPPTATSSAPTSVPPTLTPPPQEEAIKTTSPSESDSRTPYEGLEVTLQEGNSQPQYQLVTKPSSELIADTRIGVGVSPTWSDLPHVDYSLYNIIKFGVKRLDTTLGEMEEPINWKYLWGENEFPQEYDRFIDGLNENGVAVNYLLHFWDKEGYANGEELSTPRFQSAEQVQDFLDYVRFVVGHYKGRVQYYTIWTEPGASCLGSGIKCIEPNDYIDLVRQTVPVILEEDPQAKVAIAPNVLFLLL